MTQMNTDYHDDLIMDVFAEAARPTKQSPRSSGRRLLRSARKDINDIKACHCEEAARPTKQSPLSPGRRLLRSARKDIKGLSLREIIEFFQWTHS